MAKATNHFTAKDIDMDTVTSQVLTLVAGVVLNDQEQILSAAEALAIECGIAVPDFGFAA